MLGRAARVARLALPRGLPPRAPLPLRLPDAGRVPRLRRAGSSAWPRALRRERTRDAPRARGARALGRRPAPPLLQGHGAAGRARPGPGQRPRAASSSTSRCRASTRSAGGSSATSSSDLRKAGKTVLFSTHILSDAETLCDRVAVLRAGRLLKVGPLGDMLRLDVDAHGDLVSGVGAGRPRPRRECGRASRWGTGCASRWTSARSAGPWPRSRRRAAGSCPCSPCGRRSRTTSSARWAAAAGGGSRGARDEPHRWPSPPTPSARPCGSACSTTSSSSPSLMTLSGLLLGQLSIRQDEKILKDIGLAAMDFFGTLIAVFIGDGPREQGDRAPLALPAARQAPDPGRVLPREVRGARLHPAREPRRHDRGPLRSRCSPRAAGPTPGCSPRSTRSSSASSWSWPSRCCSRRSPPPPGRGLHGRAWRWPDASPTSCATCGRSRPARRRGSSEALYTCCPNFRNFDFKDRVAYGDAVAGDVLALGDGLCPGLDRRRPRARPRRPSAPGTSSDAAARAPPAPARRRWCPGASGRSTGGLGSVPAPGGGPLPVVGAAGEAPVPRLRGAGGGHLLAAHRPVLRGPAASSRPARGSTCCGRSSRSRRPSTRASRSPIATGRSS